MKVSAGTVARTICVLMALLNQILIIMGKDIIPFADNDVYKAVGTLFSAAATLAAWWKNNSFTKEAINADLIMKKEKLSKKEKTNV